MQDILRQAGPPVKEYLMAGLSVFSKLVYQSVNLTHILFESDGLRYQ